MLNNFLTNFKKGDIVYSNHSNTLNVVEKVFNIYNMQVFRLVTNDYKIMDIENAIKISDNDLLEILYGRS